MPPSRWRFCFGVPTGFIRTPRFDHRMSGEHPVGRRAALWHGGPSHGITAARDSPIAEAMRSANNPRANCSAILLVAISRVSLEPLDSTTGCPVNIRWDAAPFFACRLSSFLHTTCRLKEHRCYLSLPTSLSCTWDFTLRSGDDPLQSFVVQERFCASISLWICATRSIVTPAISATSRSRGP